tara:strand:- start:929 stop:1306 length:378 start_codon:yes stop_codon:yes gene_type:complete
MKCNSITRIREEERTIRILSRRVSTFAETQQEILLKLDKFEEYYFDMQTKIDKILNKLNKRPEYFTVGEIALREGVSEKTVRRKIKKDKIPGKKRIGDKAYKIPVEAYYNSFDIDGNSSWFQNHS